MTPSKFVSYAQHGEDVVLWRALGGRDRVFYVDIGAFDPSYDSVTRALYERGWRGVNIEPQSDRLEAFRRDRPEDINLAVAVGDEDGEVTLVVPPNPGWASIAGNLTTPEDQRVTVPLRKLSTLFAEHGIEHVDVLKIDVEGAEPAVVRGMLDGPVRPTVCVVEGAAPVVGRTAGDEAVRLLVDAGYTHCMFDGLNHYLTLDPELVEALSVPANPFDEYVTDLVERLLRERQEHADTIAYLTRENATLRVPVPPALPVTAPPAEAPTAEATPAEAPAEESSARPAPTAEAAAPAATSATVRTTGATFEAPARTGAPREATAFADPDVRDERRRETFRRLLRGPGGERQRPTRQRESRPQLGPALETMAPDAAVRALYREILGRPPEPDGLEEWVGNVEQGLPLLVAARAIAASEEAHLQPASHQARVASAIADWARVVAITETGASEVPTEHLRLGSIADQVLVAAVYEVAFRRAATPEETADALDLLGSLGREGFVRHWAAHPEVRSRLLGRVPGTRARLSRFLRRGRAARTFASLVLAAETRRLVHLVMQHGVTEALRDDDVGRGA